MRYVYFFLLLLASSCEVKVNTNSAEEESKAPVRNKSKIRNGIEVQTTGGVQVEQAFLTYAESGNLVSEENVTTINKPVKLNLVVNGWKADGNKLSLDAGQRIITSEDQVILDEKNMFAAANPVRKEEAAYLSFRFVITEIKKLLDYFIVEVAVRNEAFNQQLKARFKMYVE